MIYTLNKLSQTIKEQAAYIAELEDKLYVDLLTQVMSREAFQRDLVRLVDTGTPFGLLNIDADFLKIENDKYGHAAGDQLLKDVAQITRKVMDQTYRVGGDEFMVLIPNCQPCDLEGIKQRVRAALETGNRSASIGYAHSLTSQDIIGDSDAAMYQDKRSRRISR